MAIQKSCGIREQGEVEVEMLTLGESGGSRRRAPANQSNDMPTLAHASTYIHTCIQRFTTQTEEEIIGLR